MMMMMMVKLSHRKSWLRGINIKIALSVCERATEIVLEKKVRGKVKEVEPTVKDVKRVSTF